MEIVLGILKAAGMVGGVGLFIGVFLGIAAIKFKVKTDENMLDMVESVKEHGVLVPALVREKPEGGYEMVAGHRRKMASELAEKKRNAMYCAEFDR